jgi:hypothetical protein
MLCISFLNNKVLILETVVSKYVMKSNILFFDKLPYPGVVFFAQRNKDFGHRCYRTVVSLLNFDRELFY